MRFIRSKSSVCGETLKRMFRHEALRSYPDRILAMGTMDVHGCLQATSHAVEPGKAPEPASKRRDEIAAGIESLPGDIVETRNPECQGKRLAGVTCDN